MSKPRSPFALDAADSDGACKVEVEISDDDDDNEAPVVELTLSSTASASAHDDHDKRRALAFPALAATVAFQACAADANHAEQ